MAAPTFAKMTSLHFYAWKKGLKVSTNFSLGSLFSSSVQTGQYYLRTRPAADAIKFTVDKQQHTPSEKTLAAPSSPQQADADGGMAQYGEVCTMQDGCLSCGS